MMRLVPSLLAVTAIAALGVAAGACRRPAAEAANATDAPAAVTVGPENIVIAERGRVQSGPTISGTLTAEREASVRAQISASVLSTSADVGERVRRGAPLARLDDRTLRDAVLSARSAVRSAEVAAENASRERTRQERLLAVEAVPEKDVESARSAAESAEASLADARSRLASAEQELGYAHVTAPFDGVVSERAVSAGDVVQGGDELFTVMDPTSMRLEASVPAEALDAVRVGTAVSFSVRGYGNRRFEGRITRVSPAADPATRQVDIFASIPNAGSLVTGLFASGRIATETREGLVVPISAVDTREIAPAVVRVRGGRVERVPVTLGLRDEVSQRVEVARGVTESDTLLTGTAQQLSAGSRVVVSAAKLSDTTEGLRLEARR